MEPAVAVIQHNYWEMLAEVPALLDDRFSIKVVNLDRRPDRLRSFAQALRSAAGADISEGCERCAAVDGLELRDSPQIRHVFRGNDFSFRRGVVACALSHLSIWRSLSERGADEIVLVFEDDARAVDWFDRRLIGLIHELRGSHADFDLALLGYHMGQADGTGADQSAGAWLQPIRWERFSGGSFAYCLSAAGARRLMGLVEREGVRRAIDYFWLANRQELCVLECDPPLAWVSGEDSDIQFDFEPVPMVGTPAVLI